MLEIHVETRRGILKMCQISIVLSICYNIDGLKQRLKLVNVLTCDIPACWISTAKKLHAAYFSGGYRGKIKNLFQGGK